MYFLALYFFIYSFLGWCTEVAFAACKERRFVNRGFLNGPFCPIYGFGVSLVIAFLVPYQSHLLVLFAASVVLVTVLEGLTGWAMDRIFKHKWWDYSGMPLNIGGYVCLLFSLVWGVACVVIIKLVHPFISAAVALLPHMAGVLLIVILGLLLCADTAVTASAIFRFNRRLERMEKLAGELHELSDQIGEGIYERTVHALEGAEELKGRMEELKERYRELEERRDRVAERLLRAFPKLESRRHKARLRNLRERIKERRFSD